MVSEVGRKDTDTENVRELLQLSQAPAIVREMDCPGLDDRLTPALKTTDFYKTCQLPKRFEYPSWFYGYGMQRKPPEHPFYRTTSSDYGRYPPTIHSVPTSFFPNNQEFSKAQAKTGMYRNYSLNTGLDPTAY